MMSTAAASRKNYILNPVILRAYDIRGIVGETLHEEDAFRIGRALGTYIIKKSGASSPRIAVGYDGRLSSPMLERALVKGIVSTGVRVVRVGLGPTPMLYFAARKLDLDGGVMVTGSHNPPTHNGFKFMRGKDALFGEEIQELGRMIAAGDLFSGKGGDEACSVKEDYLAVLLKAYKPDGAKALKVAWDAGNGAAGEIMQALCARLPGEHLLLNEKIDGNFPAHHPDPTEPKNLQQLIEAVKKHRCDIGIAFDGDGDRVGAVDDWGRIISGDHLLRFFAEDVLKKHPGAAVIADVKASQTFFDAVAAMGGKPLVWKTGHSFIKSKMKETGALVAGEMSGHIFFADEYYGFDDGIYAAVRLLNFLAHAGDSLAKLVDALPVSYTTPEIRLDVPEERKFKVIEEVKARLRAAGTAFTDIDGVRVVAGGNWWLLRASNTQAALSLRCEGISPEGLDKARTELTKQLTESGVEWKELH